MNEIISRWHQEQDLKKISLQALENVNGHQEMNGETKCGISIQ